MRSTTVWCEGVGVRWNDNYSGSVMVEPQYTNDDRFVESESIPAGYVTFDFKATMRDEFSDEVYAILNYITTLDRNVIDRVLATVNPWIPVRSYETRWHLPTVIEEYGGNNYRDYEGMLNTEAYDKIVELVLMHTHTFQEHVHPTLLNAVRDIIANQLVEQMEYDEDHDHDDPHWHRVTALLADVVYNMLTASEWTMSGVDWVGELRERRNA